MLYLIALLVLILFAMQFLLLKQHQTSKLQKLESENSKLRAQHEGLGDTFKALSLDALEKNNKAFLELAQQTLETFTEKSKGDLSKRQEAIKGLLDPMKETLSKLDQGMRAIEKERKGDQESIKEQIKGIVDAEKLLRAETANLVKALRVPDVRGRWGELQLKRVVEMAGMINYCDFYEQKVADSANLRPDMVVRLPGDKQIIVDAKAPFQSFIEANQSDDIHVREERLKNHARLLRGHIQTLGKKSYWKHFEKTPEFVVLFLPAETFFSAALQYDPTLIELGAQHGVIIATPMTLIGLLRAVAYGWKQERFSRNAEEVSALGHELYKRLSDMSKHLAQVGKSLGTSVEAYNKTVGSFESRVLVSARKFQDLGAADEEIDLDPIDFLEKVPRQLQTEKNLLVE